MKRSIEYGTETQLKSMYNSLKLEDITKPYGNLVHNSVNFLWVYITTVLNPKIKVHKLNLLFNHNYNIIKCNLELRWD